MDMEQAAQHLSDFIKTYDVEKRAIDAFWNCYQNYKLQSKKGHKKYFGDGEIDKIGIYISTISLRLGNSPEYDYKQVVAHIPMEYDEIPVGEYYVCFDFDGEIFDDVFVTRKFVE